MTVRRWLLPAARILAAAVLVYLCALFALGSALYAWWLAQGWVFAGFALLTVMCVAASATGWWFLLPQVRWMGLPVTVVIAAGMFVAFT